MIKTVVREALPLYLKGPGDKAVLIIHGYTGYTGEYYPLARKLHQMGYAVSLPRLPGHGTNRHDFKSTGWKDWLNHVDNAYADLAAEYSRVFIVGLSMGGILTLILAARYNPERIVLLAPAMAVRNRMFYLTPVLRYLVWDIRKKWESNETASADRKALGNEYWTRIMLGQVAQVRKLQKIAKRHLRAVQSPVLLVLSRADATVSEKAADIIRNGLKRTPMKEILLEDSHHVLLTGCDKEFVEAQTLTWIEKGE